VGSTLADIAATGPLLLAVLVAATAGLVSFLSPCVLPLVPGYLSYVTDLAADDLRAAHQRDTAPPDPGSAPAGTVATAKATGTKSPSAARRQVLLGTAGFTAGFTIVFVTITIAFTAVGRTLLVNARTIEMIAGAIVIVLGAGYLGLIPALQRQARINRLPAAGLAGAPLLGATFGLSWTPCVSPTLGAVLALAVTDGTTGRAAALATAYCLGLGLGLPFVGVGLGLRRVLTLTATVRRHHQWITRIGGLLLITIGLALLTGGWTTFINWLRAIVGPAQIGI